MNQNLDLVLVNNFALRVKDEVYFFLSFSESLKVTYEVKCFVQRGVEIINFCDLDPVTELCISGDLTLGVVKYLPTSVTEIILAFNQSHIELKRFRLTVLEISDFDTQAFQSAFKQYDGIIDLFLKTSNAPLIALDALRKSYQHLNALQHSNVDVSISAPRNSVVTGWAWSPNQSKIRYEIQFWLNDLLVGYDLANKPIVQQKDKIRGDGLIGFQVRLARKLAGGMPHKLKIKLVDKDQRQNVVTLPEPWLCPAMESQIQDERQTWLLDMVAAAQCLDQRTTHVHDKRRLVFLSQIAPKLIYHLNNFDIPETQLLIDVAMKLIGEIPVLKYFLGELFVIKGQWEKAVHMLEQVVHISNDFSQAYMLLGYVCERLNQFKRAEVYFIAAQRNTENKDSFGVRALNAKASEVVRANDDSGDIIQMIREVEKQVFGNGPGRLDTGLLTTLSRLKKLHDQGEIENEMFENLTNHRSSEALKLKQSRETVELLVDYLIRERSVKHGS